MSLVYAAMWSTVQPIRTVFSALHQMIDDQITRRLSPYLEIGPGPDGQQRSNVIITDEQNILLKDVFVKPAAVDQLLVESELPFHVVMVSCKQAHIDIPWGALTAGHWVLEIEELCVVLTARERHEWNVEDVRNRKEALIGEALANLLKRREHILNGAVKRGSLLAMLQRKFWQSLKPTVLVKDVHLRFERFSGSTQPFSLGLVLERLEVSTTVGDGGHQETSISLPGRSGVYCRTLQVGAASVLPDSDGDVEVGVQSGAEAASDLPRGRRRTKTTERDEEQLHFFATQDRIQQRMRSVYASSAEWRDREWLFGPFTLPSGDATIQVARRRARACKRMCMGARAREPPYALHAFVADRTGRARAARKVGQMGSRLVVTPQVLHGHTHEPASFEYEVPISVGRFRLPPCVVQACEQQIAALLSLQTLVEDYKLFSGYAVRRPPSSVGRPAVGPAARAYWVAAKAAVLASLKKGRVSAASSAPQRRRRPNDPLAVALSPPSLAPPILTCDAILPSARSLVLPSLPICPAPIRLSIAGDGRGPTTHAQPGDDVQASVRRVPTRARRGARDGGAGTRRHDRRGLPPPPCRPRSVSR